MDQMYVRAFLEGLIVAGSVALAARSLGYSAFLWFLAQLFGGWFTLGAVFALPDRKLEKRRISELAILNQELAQAQRRPLPSEDVPAETIGNLNTIRNP